MGKEFEAYYSKAHAWIFVVLILLFLFGIAMFSVFWISIISLLFIVTLSIVSLVFTYVFITTIRKEGVAVQITGNKLILCKKRFVEIPIEDILKVSIYDIGGSFDISVKTPMQKFSMHCFIKEQRKKRRELISMLKCKRIEVETFCTFDN